MRTISIPTPVPLILTVVFLAAFFGGCSKAYYGAMEKVGFHKRDILIDRVEDAQAIGSLRSEFSTLKGEINGLIKQMNAAIETSNQFISEIRE